MNALVTTLRRPFKSADSGRVESSLQDALGSLSRQSCGDYVVIVAGNRRPTGPVRPNTRRPRERTRPRGLRLSSGRAPHSRRLA